MRRRLAGCRAIVAEELRQRKGKRRPGPKVDALALAHIVDPLDWFFEFLFGSALGIRDEDVRRRELYRLYGYTLPPPGSHP